MEFPLEVDGFFVFNLKSNQHSADTAVVIDTRFCFRQSTDRFCSLNIFILLNELHVSINIQPVTCGYQIIVANTSTVLPLCQVGLEYFM